MNKHNEPYEYSPLLSSREIRLLDFGKTSYDPKAKTFNCRIRHVDLDDWNCPSFVAVSYTWEPPVLKPDGLPPPSRPDPLHILCDGKVLHVKENIYDCLLQLEQLEDPDGSPETSLGWIDAICINQEDLIERGQQVTLMSKIYAKAQSTLVWLGRHDEHSRHSIPLIKQLALVNEKYTEQLDPSAEVSFRFGQLQDESFFASVGMQPFSLDDWASIAAFFTRSWFHRLWTVQELVQSQQNNGYQLLYGDTFLDSDEIDGFLVLVMAKGWINALRMEEYRRTRNPSSATSLGIEVSLAMGAIYRAKRLDEKGSLVGMLQHIFGHHDSASFDCAKLGWILNMCRQKAATDQRDRVFASSGLVTKYLAPSNWDMLSPDYSKSTSNVFTDVSRFLFDFLGNLSWLCFVEDSSFRVQQNLPSWVPDLSSMIRPTPILFLQSHDVFRRCIGKMSFVTKKTVIFVLLIPIMPDLNNWQASATRGWSSCDSKLHVKGLKVDEVAGYGSLDLDTIFNDHKITELLLSAENASSTTGSHWLTDLMYTLTAGDWSKSSDGYFTGMTEPVHSEELFVAFVHCIKMQVSQQMWPRIGRTRATDDWWDLQTKFQQLCETDSLLPSREDIDNFYARYKTLYPAHQDEKTNPYITDEDYLQEIHNPALPFVLSASPAFTFRQFVTTTMGRMCLVPQSTRPGDEIWLFASAKVPFVVRRRKAGDYEFIGHAYVHGIMQGELFASGAYPQLGPIVLR